MQIENKGTHGIYLALVAVGAAISGGGTYLAKDTNEVMDRSETERIITNELVVLKNEQLQEERVGLIEEVRRDMRITQTERLSIQNEARVENVEDSLMLQEQLVIQILEEVKK